MADDTAYDVVIIGGGPAGLTAGLYVARARLSALLVERQLVGGQIATSDWIENYPGFPEGISGMDLGALMAEQAKRFGLTIATDEVGSMDCSRESKTVNCGARSYSCGAVVVATGASPKMLGVPGEEALRGRGVSYCATCDGAFFRDKVVAVVGGGDSAIQEALFLTRFASSVHVIHRRDQLRAAKILQERALENPKISLVLDSHLTAIHGEGKVTGIDVTNKLTGKVARMEVDGVFMYVGNQPGTGFLPPQVTLDENGYIVTDESLETTLPGIFAAGDVRHNRLKQVAVSVGEGAVVAASVEGYLEEHPRG